VRSAGAGDGPRHTDVGGLAVTERSGCVRFTVRVQPRASRSAVDGRYGDALKVRISSPPVDGAANDALIDVLAKALDVPRRSVRIVAGATSRMKIVEVDGVSGAQVMRLVTEDGR
jgi:uncharacterized protein (TIGR00251 family)